MLDPKSAAQNSKPRLSFSTKPTVLASRVESDTTINVMKWKTVSTIFLVVVLYLIIGATVFKALEQPHEISQRTTIVIQKQTFISQHSCVNSTELDELIQVMTEKLLLCFLYGERTSKRKRRQFKAQCRPDVPLGTLFHFLLHVDFFFVVSLFPFCTSSLFLPSAILSSPFPLFLPPTVPSHPLLLLLSCISVLLSSCFLFFCPVLELPVDMVDMRLPWWRPSWLDDHCRLRNFSVANERKTEGGKSALIMAVAITR